MPFFVYCAPPDTMTQLAVVLQDERSWAPAVFDCGNPNVIFEVSDGTVECAGVQLVGCTHVRPGEVTRISMQRAYLSNSMVVEHELGHALFGMDHTPHGVMDATAQWPSAYELALAALHTS